MKRYFIVVIGLLLAAMYAVYFYIVGKEFSKNDLGPLGDFIGGNINPILTFISTILLIETVLMQRSAAAEAKDAEIKSRQTIDQQYALAIKQSFESSLFNLINLCTSEYKNTAITLKTGSYSGNQAFVRYVELFEKLSTRIDAADALEKMEEVTSDALFDNLKNFSTLFRFIEEFAPTTEKESYISLILTMMPTAFIQLLCIAKLHSSWPILGAFERAKIFDRPSIQHFINHYA